MLCSSVSAMPFDHGHHHDASLGSPSSAQSHCSSTARTPSPVTTNTSPATIALHDGTLTSTGAVHRPRHHTRSFSTESRFASASTSSLSGTSVQASLPPSITIDASSPPTLPVRLKRSPPRSSIIAEQAPSISASSTSLKNATSASSSAQQNWSQGQPLPSPSPPRQGGSPPRRVSTLEDIAEQKRLAVLKQHQANRRPKIMRLTPAYSSLQNMGSPSLLNAEAIALPVASKAEPDSVHFPAKEGGDNEQDPGVGLHIDLGCIPTPSIQDLEGPVSTSHLDGMIRDRNGKPIKPSLKSPRSSVSHFMPGRTSRSDSTPALPSNLRTTKSVPSTPTVTKAVHFDSQLEHVKVFKFKQRPTAVSRDGSPEQTETETEEEKDQFPYIWRTSTSPVNGPLSSQSSGARSASAASDTEEQLVLRLPNFPSSTRLSVDREIFLERIFLADDLRSVKGTVQVRNMSFEKWVAVRYTLDHWATIGEVSAEYSETIKGGQADRFTFSIKLNELLNWPRGSPAHETKSMFMCLRYTVNKTEYWDNNEGVNYQLDFRKRQIPSTPLSTPMATPLAVGQSQAGMAPSATTRTKVLELARKGGVGGKGVFAMEDLKRELDKLRSDEEEEIQSITIPRTLASEMAKKKASPPVSPGSLNNRSSSPSAWTARYDFGQSLRNPRSGSRSTGTGRAAALDYFSAKPMARTGGASADGMVRPQASYAVSIASPSPIKADRVAQLARQSPDFSHRFGMISPGLGDGPVEHKPIAPDSNTTSADTSPSPTPTPTTHAFVASERFHSFPPSRHNGTSGSVTPTPSTGTRMSPAFFTPSSSHDHLDAETGMVTSQDIGAIDLVKAAQAALSAGKEPEAGVIVEDYSPVSDCGSPNPFSPSNSVSSVDSDTTVSHLATPEDRQQKSKLAAIPAHARRTANGSAAIHPSSSTSSLDRGNFVPTMLLPGTSEPGPDRLRPASLSDYQELVNRFCWNSELVPSGGSMVPDMPTNGGLGRSTTLAVDSHSTTKLSPKIASSDLSGNSTPTLR